MKKITLKKVVKALEQELKQQQEDTELLIKEYDIVYNMLTDKQREKYENSTD